MEKDYKGLRAPYIPQLGNRKAIFIFESPPKEGAYFYDQTDASGQDQLFGAMMRQILGWPKQSTGPRWPKPAKPVGLRAFADAGYLLIDATYTPIDKDYSKPARKKVVRDNYENLREELMEYAQPETKIIVGMAPVCEVLVPLLRAVGQFNTMNTDEIIPLPMCGHEQRFGELVRPMLDLPPLKET